MKVKVGSVILGFVMICIGIAALAGQTPVFGIHPIVWFILGAMLICSDSAWEKLAHAKRRNHKANDDAEEAIPCGSGSAKGGGAPSKEGADASAQDATGEEASPDSTEGGRTGAGGASDDAVHR